MSDSQFQSLGKLIAEKLNNIITKVNTHTSDKADLTGATFTGSITVGDITLPTTDGNQNQVLTTDGNGNLSFQDVSTTDTRVTGTTVSGTDLIINLSDGNSITQDITSLVASSLKRETFTGDGSTSSYTLTDTLNTINYLEINGLIQLLGQDYTISGSTITFSENVNNGSKITVTYF